jgi:hypothetical protein
MGGSRTFSRVVLSRGGIALATASAVAISVSAVAVREGLEPAKLADVAAVVLPHHVVAPPAAAAPRAVPVATPTPASTPGATRQRATGARALVTFSRLPLAAPVRLRGAVATVPTRPAPAPAPAAGPDTSSGALPGARSFAAPAHFSALATTTRQGKEGRSFPDRPVAIAATKHDSRQGHGRHLDRAGHHHHRAG